MGTGYSVSFHNRSGDDGKFCIFQKPAEANRDNVMSLAWLVHQVNDKTDIDIDWTIDYSFVWSETGVLKPGVRFKASEVRGADPLDVMSNVVHFAKPNESYKFVDPTTEEMCAPGQLSIFTGLEIPKNHASIGIGMSGEGVFAINAQPNAVTSFIVHPEYWVIFGNYQKGEVIDIQLMTKAQKIEFKSNQYNIDITLDSTNSWKIK